ncbi:MmgE/PrpD family protein [Micromonospora sp. B11E3]|uniref:MmgE/PrpD family protein n=1 Tax=unclassified Micromonospora TaxID=2617518 RepID=UPI00325D59BD
MKEDMFATQVLAEWAAGVDAVPPPVGESVRTHVIDTLGAAVAGVGTINSATIRAAAPAIWGRGTAAMWFTGQSTTVAGAAFANAAASCALDLDDGHRQAAGHPGAAVVPGVLAAAAGSPWKDVLAAIAVGYEVGVRISAARDLTSVPTTNTGIWGGQAVAAAVGTLRRLPPEQIAHAIAIAGITAPNQFATSYTRFRANNVKEGIPWSAANGILAATLAESGFAGPIDILDNDQIFDRDRILTNLGEPWSIQTAYIKPYSCCRWLHAPIDALAELLAAEEIDPAQITGIHVETFGRTLTLSNEIAPTSIEGAQYSLPFCIGLAAVRGPDALLVLSHGDLHIPQARDLATRVTWSIDPEFDAAFPAATPGRVTVQTERGAFMRTVTAPRGEPSNPLSRAAVEAKFRAVAQERISEDTASQILHAAVSAGNADDILHLLGAEQPTAIRV